MSRPTRHLPVQLNEVLDVLRPRPGQIFVDCTLGLGGHSQAILRRISPGGRLLAIDFDPENITSATARLRTVNNSFQIFHNNFAALPSVLSSAGVDRVDGLLADLGVASPQIDNASRGFSYRHPGPLDMRMDTTRGVSAAGLLAKINERELASALLDLGDETDAPKIARLIIERRKAQPITTTEALAEIICEARDFTMQRAAGAKLHPAARSFQAIRMLVNREIPNLDRLLAVLPACLKPGATAAIISFHSGEDRRVKNAFREGEREGLYEEISPDPITATTEEQKDNPRSRSAKLRWARRAEL